MLALHVLASGSAGNAALVEDTSTGRGVLIDCGVCKRDVFARSAEAGFDLANLDAVLITHDHGDHTKGLGVVMRGLARVCAQAGACVPAVYALSEVRAACSEFAALERAQTCEVCTLALDEVLTFGNLTLRAFPTSHDAAASCGFRIESADGDALGYMTDTGVVTPEAREALFGVRVLALESNHDVRMLREGPYPCVIKARVGSDVGHLSNDQAAEVLRELAGPQLEHVVAMHLSENNNLPSLADRALRGALDACGSSAQVHCAAQHMRVSVR